MLPLGKASLSVPVMALLLMAGCSTERDKQPRELTAESRLRVAEAAEQSGDRATALAMYSAAATDPHPDGQTHLRSAEGMARNGGMAEAESLLHNELRSNPDDPELLRVLGAIQVMSGNSVAAVSTLTRALEGRPADIRIMTNKAVALDVLHRHGEAQQLYRKALSVAPGDIAISNDLALSLMLSGQREEARALLAPFRNVNDLPDRVNTNLGIIEAANGHDAEAHVLLGSRITTADLSSLTRAITLEQGISRPETAPSAAARRVIVEAMPTGNDSTGRRPVPAKVLVEPAAGETVQTETVLMPPAVSRNDSPVPRRDRRPLQELPRTATAVPAVAKPDVASAPEAARVAAKPDKPVQDVVRKTEAVPVPEAATVSKTHDPLQEDLLPKRLRELPAAGAAPAVSLKQEPLAPPAASDASGETAVKPGKRRPLQELTRATLRRPVGPRNCRRPGRLCRHLAGGVGGADDQVGCRGG